jgi:hypothetical protein
MLQRIALRGFVAVAHGFEGSACLNCGAIFFAHNY